MLQNKDIKNLSEQKSSSISAFVFDDSPIEKTGKKIEGVFLRRVNKC